ncbi:MAG: hypothetical protein OXB88_07200 [Bacteriovoracales bacterium]|nr:hypothetical protein [Bacteriovoracales bacterium]
MMHFELSEKEEKEAQEEMEKALANAKIVTREEEMEECREILDKYCKQFNISSYLELCLKADINDLDVPGDISVKIVDAYTIWSSLQKESEEESAP